MCLCVALKQNKPINKQTNKMAAEIKKVVFQQVEFTESTAWHWYGCTRISLTLYLISHDHFRFLREKKERWANTAYVCSAGAHVGITCIWSVTFVVSEEQRAHKRVKDSLSPKAWAAHLLEVLLPAPSSRTVWM